MDLKIHIRLFSQMYIIIQVRGGDMDEFFRHETLKHPSAFTKDQQMRSGNKTDLLPSLRDMKSLESSCTVADFPRLLKRQFRTTDREIQKNVRID